MSVAWEPLSPAAAELLGAAAAALLADPGPVLRAVDEAVLGTSPALAAYPDLAAQTQVTNHANAMRWLTSTARRPGERVGHDLTPEALEIARDAVRRGLDRSVLWTAYRQGQQAAWLALMRVLTDLAAADPARAAALPEALDRGSRSLHAYVDAILEGVDRRVELERGQLVGGMLARRLETIELILGDAPISERRASERLGYELGGQHIALVLAPTDAASEQGLLEGLAAELAHAGGLRSPFSVPAGASGLWTWAAAPAAPDLDAMRAVLRGAPADVTVCAGTRAPGIAGFRRSHEEAIEVQRLVAVRPAPPAFTAYEEVRVAALAGADPSRAARFAREVLGPLLHDRPELREALRVHLLEHRSATRAARRLFTHRNTVLNRVARAEALLPRPVDEQPLAVLLALELDHWLDLA